MRETITHNWFFLRKSGFQALPAKKSVWTWRSFFECDKRDYNIESVLSIFSFRNRVKHMSKIRNSSPSIWARRILHFVVSFNCILCITREVNFHRYFSFLLIRIVVNWESDSGVCPLSDLFNGHKTALIKKFALFHSFPISA